MVTVSEVEDNSPRSEIVHGPVRTELAGVESLAEVGKSVVVVAALLRVESGVLSILSAEGGSQENARHRECQLSDRWHLKVERARAAGVMASNDNQHGTRPQDHKANRPAARPGGQGNR